MPACIDPDLSYCLIDGHPLFLDLAGDRYFRLPATTVQAFLAHLDGAPLASAAARMLVARGIALHGVAWNSRDDSSDEVIAADSRGFIRDWVLKRFPDAVWYDVPRIDLG